MSTYENNAIKYRVSFVPFGSILVPETGKLALDVGNSLLPGVIDHHQPGAEEECAASLVLRYPHFVLDHLKGTPIEEITIITHVSPDLDAVTSAFFAQSLLTNGHPPPFSEAIAEYVRDVDRGICFRLPGVVVTVYSIFTALCELIRSEAKDKKWPAEKTYRMRMEKGFSLWQYVMSVMDEHIDLHDSRIFEPSHPFQDAQDLVTKDYAVYIQDLRRSKQMQFVLPHKSDNRSGMADALMVVDPESLLFRSWARGDSQHSPGGRGFAMLAVNYEYERYIISVDPQSPYYLRGLGDLLEKAEIRKRKALGKERQGEPRPGYNIPDPWYDGRNPLHNYTIVDTPRGGTVLDWGEIQKIILRYAGKRAAKHDDHLHVRFA